MDLMPETTIDRSDTLYYAASLATQAPVLEALARIAAAHPDLPPAYITVSWIQPTHVNLLLDLPSMIEPWRVALGVPADAVTEAPFRATERQTSIEARVDGLELTVWATCAAPADTDADSDGGR
ncbi:hypothetical protein [Streptomyces sp. NPDC001091]